MTILVSGLCGAVTAAQFPAYSQQYTQRLGGAVDALYEVVADFDTSAATLGLSREEALTQMTGTAFAVARQADMRRSFARHARLAADLEVLERASPVLRAVHGVRSTDPAIARRTLAAFKPAVQFSLATAVFGIFGFVSASGIVALAGRLLRWGKTGLRLSA